MTDQDPSSDTEARSAKPPSSRTFLLSVVFLGLVLVAVPVIIIFGGTDPRGDPQAGTPAAPGVPASPSTAPEPARGQLNQQVPTTGPEVTWQLYHGVALPYGQAGPWRINEAVATGYAHTPTGALIAALHINARSFVAPGQSWRTVVQQQVVANQGRRAYIEARSRATNEAPPTGFGQTAGFRFVTYTEQTAVIQFVTRFRDGELQVTTSTVRWVNGQWKVVFQPDGSSTPTVQTVTDLDRFVPWGPF